MEEHESYYIYGILSTLQWNKSKEGEIYAVTPPHEIFMDTIICNLYDQFWGLIFLPYNYSILEFETFPKLIPIQTEMTVRKYGYAEFELGSKLSLAR